ncbi:MAG: PorP/SprF family type IX secretion system membrane protein, partial [Bacteroidota bacterium]
MLKSSAFFLWISAIFMSIAQEVSLPVDFRQHNLTEYNSSLFNPVFSLDRNNPQSVSLWTRWQWQIFDADPTSLFLNYTRKLNESSALSGAFFQHNTGLFFNTGGILNYAKEIQLSSLIRLGFGVNVFGFQQELADDRFPVDPNIPLPGLRPTDDFILQLAPGIRLSVENFAFGLASENLIDYNFSDSESNTTAADKIYMAMVSYDLPVMSAVDSTAFLRPSLYLRTIPELQNQVGANLLLSRTKYWAQLGYNNFYGISAGGGATFFKRFSLGALVEFGTNSLVSSEDPSFEIVASYFLGRPEERRKIQQLFEDKIDQEVELITEEEKKETEVTTKEVEAEQKRQQKQLEKEAKELAAQEKAMARQRRKDSLATVKEDKKALAATQKEEKENDRLAMENEERLAAEKAAS